jgi:Na+/H+-dicarboxylate symporter
MATAVKHAGSSTRPVSPRWATQRAFFTGISLLMVFAVFLGFSRSYYLKGLYGTPALPTLFHVHGLLFTGWMVFLVVQTGLVASRRTDLHRRIGVAGGVLAAAMTVAAMAMTIDLARRSATAPTDIGLAFTIVPFFTVVVFPVLVGIALLYRRQPEVHKRLMVIATLELVTAGVARIPGAGSMPLFFVLTDVGLVAILLYDVVTRGRPHSATVWGGLFLIATQVVRTTAGASAAWIAFARVLATA